MKIKLYDKILKRGVKPIPKPLLNLIRAPRLNLFSKVRGLFRFLSFIDRISFSLLFVIFLVLNLIFILWANKISSDKLVNTLVKQYPNMATVPASSTGKPLYTSPLDKLFQEFTARQSGAFFLFFGLLFRNFLRTIWLNYNTRKPQIIGRV